MLVDLIIFGGLALLVRYKLLKRRMHWALALASLFVVWVGSVALVWWSAMGEPADLSYLGRSIWYGLTTGIVVFLILCRKPSEESEATAVAEVKTSAPGSV